MRAAARAGSACASSLLVWGLPTWKVDEPVVRGQYRYLKADRLTRKAEFQQVFKLGGKVVGTHFICYWAPRDKQGCAMGLAVSRKVGNAVVRNRLKRYLRECYRTLKPQFQKSGSMVIVARPASAKLSYAECVEAVRSMWRRGGVLDA